MAATGYPSPLANNVAARARISKVRQMINLEPRPGQMTPQAGVQPIQPQPGPAPKAVVSPQAQAVMGPQMVTPPPQTLDGLHVPAQGSGEPFQYQMPEGHEDIMQQMAAQQLVQQSPTPTPEEQPPTPAESENPIAAFYQATKRLPTPQELAVIGAHRVLSQKLGRPPTATEVQQYFQPKGAS